MQDLILTRLRRSKFKHVLATIIWIGLSNISNAQFKTEPIAIPPSPNAASLMEYANIPVNYYSGVGEIDVPLFDLQSRNINVPISLSYHTSGIKVQDIASSFGLGWALNAGGAITRVVRGSPAENFCGDYFDKFYYGLMLSGSCDSQPDIFYFNFLGKTGRFVLDQEGNPVLIPHQNYKIVPAIGALGTGKWEIIDENGYKYIFGETSADYEYTISELMNDETYSGLPSNQERFISTWYLSKVVDPYNNTEITFEYDGTGADLVYEYFAEKTSRVIYETSTGGCPTSLSEHEQSNTKIIVEDPKYLKKIITPLGQANFTFLPGRIDLSGGRYLSNLLITDQFSSHIKNYTFNYDYFKPTNSFLSPGTIPPPYSDSNFTGCFDCYRLKLLNIEINGLKLREFTYNESIDLPPRYSVFEDHWGYFNGHSGMYSGSQHPGYTSKIPQVIYEGILLQGSSKEAYFTTTKANILTEVKYPTNGSTELIYESNGSSGGVRVQKIIDKDNNQPKKETEIVYSDQGFYQQPQYYFTTHGMTGSSNHLSFIIPINFDCFVEYLYISSSSYNSLFNLNGNCTDYGKVTIKNIGNGKEDLYFTSLNSPHNDELPVAYYDVKYQGDILPPGLELSPLGPPFAAFTSKFWERGLLTKKETFSESNGLYHLVKREINDYYFDVPSFKEVDGVSVMSLMQTQNSISQEYHAIYSFGKYKMISKPILLKNQTTEIFDQSDPGNESKKIVSATEYSYVPVHPQGQTLVAKDLYPRKTIFTYPNGDKIVTQNKFVRDYTISQTPMSLETKGLFYLQSKNISNALVESLTYLETSTSGVTSKYLSDGKLNLYKEFPENSGFPNLWQSKTLITGSGLLSTIEDNSDPNTFFWSHSPAGEFGWVDNKHKTVFTASSYDAYGNLKSAVADDGVPLTYNWSHSNSLLADVTKNGGDAFEHKALIQYQGQVGVTRLTDPNGRESNFIYDKFKRLKLVTDHTGQIMSRYRYHFKDQYESLEARIVSIGGGRSANSPTTITSSSESTEYGTTTYTWDFGDGSPVENSTLPSITHTYTSSNQYRITLTKSNPGHGSASTSTTVFIAPQLTLSICADGPVEIDFCRDPNNTDSYGGCTDPSRQIWGAETLFRASGSEGCSAGNYTYVWEYDTGNGWQIFGSNSNFAYSMWGAGTITGSGYIRCRITDTCGTVVTSNEVFFNFYKSDPNCE